MGQAVQRHAWLEDGRQWTWVDTIEVQTGYKEKLFHREGSQAVEQVVQGGCALRPFENPSWIMP